MRVPYEFTASVDIITSFIRQKNKAGGPRNAAMVMEGGMRSGHRLVNQSLLPYLIVVAGAGFEPATFGE